MKKIIIVACVAKKQTEPTRAAEMYTSTWFIKTRRLVDATGEPWFILSAKYGLLKPRQMIAPYDQSLNSMSQAERREWALIVRRQMEKSLPEAPQVVVLAGKRYRENLMPYLLMRFSSVTVPMQGLSIGRQLNWLSNTHVL